MFEEALQHQYLQIAKQAARMIPTRRWRTIKLHAEVNEGGGTVYFFFDTADHPGEYRYSELIEEQYQIPHAAYSAEYNKLWQMVEQLRQVFLTDGQAAPQTFNLVVNEDLSVRLNMRYTPWYLSKFTLEERMAFFEYHYVKELPPDSKQLTRLAEMQQLAAFYEAHPSDTPMPVAFRWQTEQAQREGKPHLTGPALVNAGWHAMARALVLNAIKATNDTVERAFVTVDFAPDHAVFDLWYQVHGQLISWQAFPAAAVVTKIRTQLLVQAPAVVRKMDRAYLAIGEPRPAFAELQVERNSTAWFSHMVQPTAGMTYQQAVAEWPRALQRVVADYDLASDRALPWYPAE